ncbi:MAG: hypothetical protein HRT61_19950 [Ekhidna sp.]|nr:hypothetical protein [Ekhidna sp.]
MQLKCKDEVQMGMPGDSVDAVHRMRMDFSRFSEDGETLTKKEKKKATEAFKKIIARWHNRQRQTKNLIWGSPEITINGTRAVAKLKLCKLGQICVETWEEMGRFYKMDVVITGDYQIGQNWYDTH